MSIKPTTSQANVHIWSLVVKAHFPFPNTQKGFLSILFVYIWNAKSYNSMVLSMYQIKYNVLWD